MESLGSGYDLDAVGIDVAPSALGTFSRSDLGRWPRLLHFAALALANLSRFAAFVIFGPPYKIS
jgi:hypothetical protein